MDNLFTIGFTKKTAKEFFEILKQNGVETLLDIRLNNTSQLAGFSKYPDIKYFLGQICNIKYIHDVLFAPLEETLDSYKKKKITWQGYVNQFNETMNNRQINDYINLKYLEKKNLCLLCSEEKADKCHRSLVAEHFTSLKKDFKIIHL